MRPVCTSCEEPCSPAFAIEGVTLCATCEDLGLRGYCPACGELTRTDYVGRCETCSHQWDCHECGEPNTADHESVCSERKPVHRDRVCDEGAAAMHAEARAEDMSETERAYGEWETERGADYAWDPIRESDRD